MCIDLVCRTSCDIHTYSSNLGHAFESFMLRCKSVQGYCWRKKLSDSFENPRPMPPFPPVQSWQDDTFGNPPPHDPLPPNTKLNSPGGHIVDCCSTLFRGEGGAGRTGMFKSVAYFFRQPTQISCKFKISYRFKHYAFNGIGYAAGWHDGRAVHHFHILESRG